MMCLILAWPVFGWLGLACSDNADLARHVLPSSTHIDAVVVGDAGGVECLTYLHAYAWSLL